MTLREVIESHLSENPTVKNRHLAMRLNCSEAYISTIKNGRRSNGKGFKRVYFGNMKKIRAAYLWGQDWGVPEISMEIGVPVNMIIVFLQQEGLT